MISGGPDIDIHVKKQCTVFLKNTKIDSGKAKQIWREMRVCKKCGLTKVFYGINFIKNLSNIEYIRRSFEKIRKGYPDLILEIFDIKDLVSILLDELKRSR